MLTCLELFHLQNLCMQSGLVGMQRFDRIIPLLDLRPELVSLFEQRRCGRSHIDHWWRRSHRWSRNRRTQDRWRQGYRKGCRRRWGDKMS